MNYNTLAVGFPVKIKTLAKKKKLKEVVYGSYETREEALTVLREVRKTQNEDAWLLVKDLDLIAAE